MEVDSVVCMDALELLNSLEKQSADAIISDFPYGTTAAAWDVMPDLPVLWEAIKHALKPSGVVVTTASQPFTSMLVMSNLKWFRYEWIWEKEQGSNFLDAWRKPYKTHENIVVFSPETPTYRPQFTSGDAYVNGKHRGTNVYGAFKDKQEKKTHGRLPKSIIRINRARGLHDTQKPVALYEYLILTYTQAGDIVCDPFCGSGTTGIAARNTGRHYIMGDTSAEYVAIARKRLALPYTVPMFE